MCLLSALTTLQIHCGSQCPPVSILSSSSSFQYSLQCPAAGFCFHITLTFNSVNSEHIQGTPSPFCFYHFFSLTGMKSGVPFLVFSIRKRWSYQITWIPCPSPFFFHFLNYFPFTVLHCDCHISFFFVYFPWLLFSLIQEILKATIKLFFLKWCPHQGTSLNI